MLKKLLHPSETGSVLVITMLVMISLTAIGMMSIYTGIVEMHIGRNERQLQETFYSAEACAVETIQVLSSMSAIDLQEKAEDWLHSHEEVEIDQIDFRNPYDWNFGDSGEVNAAKSKVFADTYFSAVEWDVAGGESLIIGNHTRLYQMRIYSLCHLYGANELIEIGYRLRY